MRFSVPFGAKVFKPAYLLFFIRFSGCNLSFYFGDTDQEQGERRNDGQIQKERLQYTARPIV